MGLSQIAPVSDAFQALEDTIHGYLVFQQLAVDSLCSAVNGCKRSRISALKMGIILHDLEKRDYIYCCMSLF